MCSRNTVIARKNMRFSIVVSDNVLFFFIPSVDLANSPLLCNISQIYFMYNRHWEHNVLEYVKMSYFLFIFFLSKQKSYFIKSLSSRKHAYMILTHLNPSFI